MTLKQFLSIYDAHPKIIIMVFSNVDTISHRVMGWSDCDIFRMEDNHNSKYSDNKVVRFKFDNISTSVYVTGEVEP